MKRFRWIGVGAPLACIILLLSFVSGFGVRLDKGTELVTSFDNGLMWVADAQFVPNQGASRSSLMGREEAERFIAEMNSGAVENFGYHDWRFASVGELRLLARIDLARGDLSELKQYLANLDAEAPASISSRALIKDTIYTWPIRGIVAPDGFEDVVVFAANSAYIQTDTSLTGNVVVNNIHTTDTIDPATDVELRLDRAVTVNGDVQAANIRLDKNSDVTGLISCTSIEDADNPPETCAAISLPVFQDPPEFQSADLRPDAPDLFIDDGEVVTIPLPPAPGDTEGIRDFNNITIAQNGTLVFEGGGVFNIGSISDVTTAGGQCPYPCRSVLFSEFADVRIEGRFAIAKNACVGAGSSNADCPGQGVVPASGTAAILYVGGSNGGDGSAAGSPAAFFFERDSTLGVNVYAPNGSIDIDSGTAVKGAFLARDVTIDKNSEVLLDSAFANEPPDAQDLVFFTNGDETLEIELVASDPEGGALTYAIVAPGLSDPSAGTLGPIVENFENVPGDPPGCTPGVDCIREPGTVLVSVTVTYDPATDQNEFNSFQYKVTDDHGEMDTATVTINPGDDPGDPGEQEPPVGTVIANDIAGVEVIEGNDVTITLTGEAPCDEFDAGTGACTSGVAISFSIQAGCSVTACDSPNFGTLSNLTQGSETVQRTATVLYAPNMGHLGADSFEFEACGNIPSVGVVCDRGTVSVTTAEAPEPAEDQEVTAEAQIPVSITLGGAFSGGASSSSEITFRLRPTFRAVGITDANASGVVADTDQNGSGDESGVYGLVSPALNFGGSGTFSDEENFLFELPNSTSYDFETGSGFPSGGGAIGTVDGISFSATTISSSSSTSGTQSMTGAGGTFTTATVDFSGLSAKPNGFGFYALDLTHIGAEVIRVTVDFTSSADQDFDVQLGPSDPAFTPIFFGLIDPSDTIEKLTFIGTESASFCDPPQDQTGEACRAWLIDDLTVGRVFAGEARTEIEYDVAFLGSFLSDLTGASIHINGHANALGLADTQLYWGTNPSNATLSASDFQAPAQILGGAVLSASGMAVGDVQSFSFNVLEQVHTVLEDGGQFFTIQGRVAAPGGQGLQIFGTTTKNFDDFLVPNLTFSTPPPIPPILYTIESLPTKGTLYDSGGMAITMTGVLTDGNLTYVADPLADPSMTETDSFTFSLFGDFGIITIFISDHCAEVGRPPGCSPDF